MQLKNKLGKTYVLESTPIGSGGEGDIYPVKNESGQVAKIYKAGAMSKELEVKLNVMVANPPSKAVFTQVAWPMDVLYDNAGQCRGFVMPRLNITHELGEIYKYPSQLPLSSRQKVNIAQNICVVISEVHKAGYVFGDFNPRNIGLDISTGLVSFLDTDTYHVFDRASGITHRCNVCAPGYAAPELLEKCSNFVAANPADSKFAYARTPLPTFTQETDNFALAIHVFKLLMNGYTPFGGIIESASVSQSSPGVGDAAVKRDSYCFKPGFKHQSAAILPLDVFPQEVADLFTRAFIIGKVDPTKRPRAEEWYGTLVKLGQNMKVCRIEPLHHYYRENKSCPLCEADERFMEIIGESSKAAVLRQSAYYSPIKAKASTNAVRSSSLQPSKQTTLIAQPPKRSRLHMVLVASLGVLMVVMVMILANTGGYSVPAYSPQSFQETAEPTPTEPPPETDDEPEYDIVMEVHPDDFPGIIAIVSSTFDWDPEAYRAAQALVERFGEDRVIHKAWHPFYHGSDYVRTLLLTLAINPDVGAIVINPAHAYTIWAIDEVRAWRGDDIFIAVGSPAENPWEVSMRVDLALEINYAAVGEHFVAQAVAMGALAIVHYSFPRHMAMPHLAERRDSMARAAQNIGIPFHDLNSPDPMAEGGMPASQLFIAQDLPRRVEEFGINTVFFSTNCGQQIPLINGVLETGAMFVQPCCPSPFHVFPVSFGMAFDQWDAVNAFSSAEIVGLSRQTVADAGMTFRLSNWAFSGSMAWTYVGFMYAALWLGGNAPGGGGEEPCMDIVNRLFGDFAYELYGERMYMALSHHTHDSTVFPMIIAGLPPFIMY